MMTGNRNNMFALLITWTCYGTWLPGDKRGYVSNTRKSKGEFELKQNTYGTPYTRDNIATSQQARLLQRQATVLLSAKQALCAVKGIVKGTSDRNWNVLRCAVMANHVHVVVTECPDDGPTVRRVLKGVSQAALSRQNQSPRRWWTQGGSDRYLHGERAIAAAMRYVENQDYLLAKITDMQVFASDENL